MDMLGTGGIGDGDRKYPRVRIVETGLIQIAAVEVDVFPAIDYNLAAEKGVPAKRFVTHSIEPDGDGR